MAKRRASYKKVPRKKTNGDPSAGEKPDDETMGSVCQDKDLPCLVDQDCAKEIENGESVVSNGAPCGVIDISMCEIAPVSSCNDVRMPQIPQRVPILPDISGKSASNPVNVSPSFPVVSDVPLRSNHSDNINALEQCVTLLPGVSHESDGPGSHTSNATSVVSCVSGCCDDVEVSRNQLNYVTDENALSLLEKAGRLNWWTDICACQRLIPILVTGDDDCLLHATSVGVWRVQDHHQSLHQALFDMITKSNFVSSFQRRWRYRQTEQNPELKLKYGENEWQQQWSAVISLASPSSTISQNDTAEKKCGSLDEVHVFALAHILRRPIIVLADTITKEAIADALAPACFGGVYLPLELPPELCFRRPLILAYNLLHFSALLSDVCTERSGSQSKLAVPLVDAALSVLPIHFAMDPGVDWNGVDNVVSEDSVLLLQHYLDIDMVDIDIRTGAEVFDSVIMCALLMEHSQASFEILTDACLISSDSYTDADDTSLPPATAPCGAVVEVPLLLTNTEPHLTSQTSITSTPGTVATSLESDRSHGPNELSLVTTAASDVTLPSTSSSSGILDRNTGNAIEVSLLSTRIELHVSTVASVSTEASVSSVTSPPVMNRTSMESRGNIESHIVPSVVTSQTNPPVPQTSSGNNSSSILSSAEREIADASLPLRREGLGSEPLTALPLLRSCDDVAVAANSTPTGKNTNDQLVVVPLNVLQRLLHAAGLKLPAAGTGDLTSLSDGDMSVRDQSAPVDNSVQDNSQTISLPRNQESQTCESLNAESKTCVDIHHHRRIPADLTELQKQKNKANSHASSDGIFKNVVSQLGSEDDVSDFSSEIIGNLEDIIDLGRSRGKTVVKEKTVSMKGHKRKSICECCKLHKKVRASLDDCSDTDSESDMDLYYIKRKRKGCSDIGCESDTNLYYIKRIRKRKRVSNHYRAESDDESDNHGHCEVVCKRKRKRVSNHYRAESDNESDNDDRCEVDGDPDELQIQQKKDEVRHCHENSDESQSDAIKCNQVDPLDKQSDLTSDGITSKSIGNQEADESSECQSPSSKKRNKKECPVCGRFVIHIPRHLRHTHKWDDETARAAVEFYQLRKPYTYTKKPLYDANGERREPSHDYHTPRPCPVEGCRAVVKRLPPHLVSRHKIDRNSNLFKELLLKARQSHYEEKSKLLHSQYEEKSKLLEKQCEIRRFDFSTDKDLEMVQKQTKSFVISADDVEPDTIAA